jgi:uncharacterized protein
LKFEWDPRKAASNFSKHGVRFEMAQRVFEDPHHLSKLQTGGGEDRWATVGVVEGLVTLFVVHTFLETETETESETGTEAEVEEAIRLISARRATPPERKAYEQGN